MNPIAKTAIPYFGMLALLLAVFVAIGLAILGGAPGWLLILMVGVGAAALRIGNWWLPVLTHRYMNKEQA